MQHPALMYNDLHCRMWTRRRTSTCVRAECVDVQHRMQCERGFTAPHVAIHWCTWMYGDARRRTAMCMCAYCVNVWCQTQGLRKPRKVQNMPLIWCKCIHHMTNSSHIIGHLLHTLHSLCYMCCVACIRRETVLNAGCQLREDAEWANCRSNNAHVERFKRRRRTVAANWPYIQAFQSTVPAIIIAYALLLNAQHLSL